MSDQTVFLTDDPSRSRGLFGAVPSSTEPVLVALFTTDLTPIPGCRRIIVDVSLSDPETITVIKQCLDWRTPDTELIFIGNPADHLTQTQANFLGATDVVARADLATFLRSRVPSPAPPPEVVAAIEQTASVSQSVFDAAASGAPLPSAEVDKSCSLISDALKTDGIGAWLEGLKSHHSYTHRHSMHVAGFAVSFALTYGMRDFDVQRIALGALMHDVGKARIPLEILDKATPLTEAERLLIRRHAEFSDEILARDGQFDAEVIDIARHHHEWLDGTGYPDGLSGDAIGDLVRIVTIADVFSALIDQRAYKDSLTREEAYETMLAMTGKLDFDILRAFEPIATDVQPVPLSKLIAA